MTPWSPDGDFDQTKSDPAMFVQGALNRTHFGGMKVDGNVSGQIIATSAEVTPNGGLVRESSHNPLNSGLGIIVICPDVW